MLCFLKKKKRKKSLYCQQHEQLVSATPPLDLSDPAGLWVVRKYYFRWHEVLPPCSQPTTVFTSTYWINVSWCLTVFRSLLQAEIQMNKCFSQLWKERVQFLICLVTESLKLFSFSLLGYYLIACLHYRPFFLYFYD